MKILLFAILTVLNISIAYAQQITNTEKKSAIDTLLSKIESHYVYPDVAKKMADAVRRRMRAHAYDTVSNGIILAKMLSEDLRSVSHDGHLGVDYSANVIPEEAPGTPPSQQVIDDFRKRGAGDNFAFRKLEIFEGNIGYLKLNIFWPGDWIKETAAGAMAMLANSDAIIIDLRDNHGFAPDGVILVESYFFKDETHMTDQVNNDEHTTRQYWTLPAVPGNRLSDKKLYLLVSHDTFSAGEDFAYNMQAQKRATVIGEATGGGAHGTRPYRINSHFSAGIPFSYSINPITHADWEGKGVQPDIVAAKEQALLVAEITVIKDMTASAKDENRKKYLENLITQKEKELEAMKAK
ncbi:MAG: S41 family peptidase [Bacteroidota bacterium]